MTEPTRYALDARADNYGWEKLDESPATIPVVEEPPAEDASALSLPLERTPPNVLNRVNAWLSAHSREAQLARHVLEPLGVHDGNAILAVRDSVGFPASARDALKQIVDGVVEADPRTQELLGTFLGHARDRVHEVSPTELLESVKSSFAVRSPLSVKSSFANTSRSAVQLMLAPDVLSAPAGAPGIVVALPDTGIGLHPWLSEGTWVDAESEGWLPTGPALPDPGESDASPADSETDVFAGHGTFVAGLIRQLAPSARLLSLHSMAGDGTQPGERVLDGLGWIRDRVATGMVEQFVDVVCLACGYYEPSPSTDGHTTRLASVLGELGDLGVQVVVAAGNDATESPTFPAAFARLAIEGTRPRTPLVAVGALNPDGSRTRFSNSGDWVAAWQPGVALISSLPTSFGQESERSQIETFDPSNLVGGFAQWSGSSFAAAVLAGKLASALQETKATIADVHDRTRAARESLGIGT